MTTMVVFRPTHERSNLVVASLARILPPHSCLIATHEAVATSSMFVYPACLVVEECQLEPCMSIPDTINQKLLIAQHCFT